MTARRRDDYFSRGGYRKLSLVLNRVFDITLSLLFLLCAAPFFIVIAAVIKVQDGGPIFYNSQRLGKNKVPFTMFKFRTMVVDADRIIGENILQSNRDLVTTFGKFLRNTRLDELPQLLNIVKGDMMFVGPRPLPPILYETVCRDIVGYDKRFAIKPGLIGFSQLFTPHSAPKRIRSLIDNKLLTVSQNFLWDGVIVFFTIAVVLKNIVLVGGKLFWSSFVRGRLLRQYSEKRKSERIRPKKAILYVESSDGQPAVAGGGGRIVDINEDAILFFSDAILGEEKFDFRIRIFHRNRHGREVTKTASCIGQVYRRQDITGGTHPHAYVIKYSPRTPFNHYLVHQYLLKESITL